MPKVPTEAELKAQARRELEELLGLGQFRYEIMQALQEIRLDILKLRNDCDSDYEDAKRKFEACAAEFTSLKKAFRLYLDT